MVSLSGPGIFWVNSGVAGDVLPYGKFVRWYQEIHIPDWMGAKAGAVPAGVRYQSVGERRQLPFLVIYRFKDLADLGSAELRSVPLTHPSLPDGGPINRFTTFQAMAGPHIETWKAATTPEKGAELLASESIEVPQEEIGDFHSWYRQQYVRGISEIRGWVRTSRFENAMGRVGGGNGVVQFVTLHEFERGSLDLAALSSHLRQSAEAEQTGR